MKIILFFSVILLFTTCQNKSGIADIALLNGSIITMDYDNPGAEAFAILNGNFIKVGSNDEVKQLIGKKTRVIDAGGKTIIPGFDDCHIHPRPVFPFEHRLGIVNLGPDSIANMDELIEVLKRKAEITPEGEWIRGFGYEDTKLGRHPTREDLDKVSTTHPILLDHSSLHVFAVNSYALEAANINRHTPDPPGSAFDRDANGEPNGICREYAHYLITDKLPLPQASDSENIEGLKRCFQEFYSNGITSITDARANPESIKNYQKLIEEGEKMRISLMIEDEYLEDLKKLNIKSNFGNDHLKILSIKVYHGNSLSGRTCWLKEPYDMINPRTGKKDYYGIPPARSQDELDSLIYEIHAAGFQAAVHSNGDREIPMVLEAFEKALERLPRDDHRHRIEHYSVVDESILKKTRDLGILVATHSYVYEHGDKMEEYGQERWNMMHPNKSAIDMGIPVGGNSDWPVSAAIPLLRIQSLITRTTKEGELIGPKQLIDLEDALYVWTMGSAFFSFDEDIKGSITKGKYADFVILSDNPELIEKENVKDIIVENTFIGGEEVFSF